MNPLTASDRDFLKSTYQNLADRPLNPSDPFYEPPYAYEGADDPVEAMLNRITFTQVQSLQLFSGFRGAGKTTELFRLRHLLQQQGYVVLYGDALQYLNPAEPIDVTILLVVLAGSFSDALQQLDIEIADEPYWTRLWNYLTTTRITVPEATAKLEVENPLKDYVGGLTAGVDVKLALQTTPGFRQRLREFLTTRVAQLKADVDKFVEDGIKRIRKNYPNAPGIVFLFDSLEQLRGSISTEDEVTRSVELFFSHHIRMIEVPYVHVVCCAPPWLQFVMPNIAPVVLIPNVKLWNNDDRRSRSAAGWDFLRRLLRKRFGENGCERFFGPPGAGGEFPGADRIIESSGGHFRELMRLLQETLTRTRSLPVNEDAIELAIQAVRRSFLPIAIEDAHWLEAIGRMRTAGLPSSRAADAARLTRFLDTHFVLYLTNGEPWYDIHPLIRDEVSSIAARHPTGAAGNRLI
ncbi:MAG: hypothetical protein KIT09_06075 [Bryobacteraceae bacterium]|nr:hypothetical protein [Bryobacteraceae bacterium]